MHSLDRSTLRPVAPGAWRIPVLLPGECRNLRLLLEASDSWQPADGPDGVRAITEADMGAEILIHAEVVQLLIDACASLLWEAGAHPHMARRELRQADRGPVVYRAGPGQVLVLLALGGAAEHDVPTVTTLAAADGTRVEVVLEPGCALVIDDRQQAQADGPRTDVLALFTTLPERKEAPCLP